MKVKIFNFENERDLEDNINEFIEEIEHDHMEVKDIKYSTNVSLNDHDEQIYIYSALVMYGDDGILRLDWEGAPEIRDERS